MNVKIKASNMNEIHGKTFQKSFCDGDILFHFVCFGDYCLFGLYLSFIKRDSLCTLVGNEVKDICEDLRKGKQMI